jgi:hypothetical protein
MNETAKTPSPREIPPGSTALRELAFAVSAALTLPRKETELLEIEYLRISRFRARLVRAAMRKIIDDHELSDQDLMEVISHLRAEVGESVL